jgi:Zn-dependent peptidase ImmA (M78 family)
MKLPKSIHIAGVPVKIIQEDLSDEDNLSKGYYGYYSDERRVIVIEQTLSPKVAKATMRHEMLHASLALSGLNRLERFEEEAIVRCMDSIFFPAWERFLKRLNF